jgi:hypothetical protein
MDTSMTQPPISESANQNPKVTVSHRSFILQVVLPLTVGVLILAVGIVMLWQAGIGTASAWADASLIFILLPWLCVGFVPLILFAAMWYGVFRLTAWLPDPLRKGKKYLDQGGDYLRKGTDFAVKPIFVVKGVWAVVIAFFRGLGSIIGFSDGENYG